MKRLMVLASALVRCAGLASVLSEAEARQRGATAGAGLVSGLPPSGISVPIITRRQRAAALYPRRTYYYAPAYHYGYAGGGPTPAFYRRAQEAGPGAYVYRPATGLRRGKAGLRRAVHRGRRWG